MRKLKLCVFMKSDKIFLIVIGLFCLSLFSWTWHECAQKTREMNAIFAKTDSCIQIYTNNRIKAQYEFSIAPKIVYNKQHCPKKPIKGSKMRKVGTHRRLVPYEYNSTDEFRIFAVVVGTSDSIRFNVSGVLFDKLQVGNAIDTITGYHFILL